jgi:hypothetical protein
MHQQVDTRRRHRVSLEMPHFTPGDWSYSETTAGEKLFVSYS